MCLWDVWRVSHHALKPDHNWSKVSGSTAPTLAGIKPYLEAVLTNGTWQKVGDAHGPGGRVIGEILEAEADVGGHTVWVRAFKQATDGQIIVNNGGVR